MLSEGRKKIYKSISIHPTSSLQAEATLARVILGVVAGGGGHQQQRQATKGFKIGQLNSIRFNEDGTARMHEGEIVIKKVQGHVPKSGAPREKPPTKDATITYRLTRDDISGGPVNLDEIEPGLWLGNVTAAADLPTLEKLAIRSVLTIDSCPLPAHVTENPGLRVKYIQGRCCARKLYVIC